MMKNKNLQLITVIGDGIIGKATALKLAQAGQDICLIKSMSKPYGYASAAAGAMLGVFGEVTANANTPLDQHELDFRFASAKMYPDWLQELQEISGIETHDILNCGTTIIANSVGPQDLTHLHAIEAALQHYKVSYSHVVQQDVPFLKPHQSSAIIDALYIPTEGYVNSVRLNHILDTAIDNHPKISVVEGWCEQITKNADVFAMHLSASQILYTEKLIIAAGVGTNDLLRPFRQHALKSTPQIIVAKGVGVTFEYPHDLTGVIRTPNRGFACGVHIIPQNHNTFYLGATNRVTTNPNLLQGVLLSEMHFLLDTVVREINADLKLANLQSVTHGSRPLASDHYPLIGKTDVPHLYIATGTYRNGILMAPLVAQLVTDAVLDHEATFHHHFSPERSTDFVSIIEANKAKIFENSIKEYIELLHEPGGYLPYANAKEAEIVMSRLIQATLLNEHNETGMFIRDMFNQYPIAEIWPEIFVRLKLNNL